MPPLARGSSRMSVGISVTQKGCLYVVATPIGNLQDISPRALEVLQQVTEIAAEDTRHSLKLLRHFGVKTPCVSLHDHNESRVVPGVISKLQAGCDIALISDAGTPLISDPGFQLVKAAIEGGINVVTVPGPCALIAALSISGLPADRFIFEGFLPAKQGARRQRLQVLASETRTLIFYESCHRLMDAIEDMRLIFGDERSAVVIKELTKLYEHVERLTLDNLSRLVAADERFKKAEYVVLVAGGERDEDAEWQHAVEVMKVLLGELSVKQASKLAAQITGISKKRLYQHAIEQQD